MADDDDRSSNPIIAAMQEDNDVRAEVIEAILEEHPEALRQRDEEGYLPIHYAIMHVLPPHVVRLLLEAWPGSVCERTGDG